MYSKSNYINARQMHVIAVCIWQEIVCCVVVFGEIHIKVELAVGGVGGLGDREYRAVCPPDPPGNFTHQRRQGWRVCGQQQCWSWEVELELAAGGGESRPTLWRSACPAPLTYLSLRRGRVQGKAQ